MTYVSYCLILCACLQYLNANTPASNVAHNEQVVGQMPPASITTVPWYESLPAVAMDYKVHIDPGKEDCYYQFVNRGATFYVSFQVIRGGDGMAGFAVKNPAGDVVHPYQWLASSDYQDQESMGGYYSVCVDNRLSRFADKLVSLYLTVVRYDEWEKYTKYIEDSMSNLNNFTEAIVGVERDINEVKQYLHYSRSRESRDYSLLLYNNIYVLRWSLIQITLVIITSLLQVYFVRKLFDVKSKTRT